MQKGEMMQNAACGAKSDASSETTQATPLRRLDGRGISLWPWVTLALSAIPFTLLLMGYGVTLVVEEKLGVPRTAVFGSSLDLLELGSLPVVMWLERASDWMGAQFWSDIWAQNWFASALFGAVAVMMAAALLWPHRWTWLESRTASTARRISARDRRWWWVAAFAALAAGFPWMVGVLVRLMLGLLILPLGFVLAGANLGHAYLEKYVMSQQECKRFPVAKSPSESDGQGALCIALDNSAGVEVARGRLVVSTQKAFVLLHAGGLAQPYRADQHTPRVVDHL